ncbi:MAG: hypothetical protein EWM47_06505 [Anaerolineaceae bacterium]|nr:MAG: hypothetical protein EWM47_06505 [Anaerolineaceae bacterium]
MIQNIYNNNIIIYTFAALCGLGILVRAILDMVYIYLVKESDRLGTTKNKLLKHMKMKFETCYKLNIGVNNVDTFVDKSLTKYRFCGILLSTWENFSGQVLLLSFLIIPISAVFGVVFEISRDQILYTGAVGVLTGAALILADKMTNLPVKKQMIRLNLLDYLENFCKVRLEHEVSQPEKLEQYRLEYLAAIGTKVKNIKTESENKEELSRRQEARKRKEEEKRLQALKREEEQKRIDEARKQEEIRKLEERKQQAARRREEELKKIQEEREALKIRREELKKKAEEKQRQNELKRLEKEEKEKILNSIEEELRGAKKSEEKQIIESIEEVAAELEESIKATHKKQEQNNLPEMSPEEEKLVEDVLREFFA